MRLNPLLLSLSLSFTSAAVAQDREPQLLHGAHIPSCSVEEGLDVHHPRISLEQWIDAVSGPSLDAVLEPLEIIENGACKKLGAGDIDAEHQCTRDKVAAARMLAIYATHFLEIASRSSKIPPESEETASEGYAYLSCQVQNLNKLSTLLKKWPANGILQEKVEEAFNGANGNSIMALQIIKDTISAASDEGIDPEKIVWFMFLGFDPNKIDQVIKAAQSVRFVASRDGGIPDIFADGPE